MKQRHLFNLRAARQVISSGSGRKPNLHWKILFGFGLLSLCVAFLASGFVFWWGTKGQGEGDGGSANHSFNKKQFESVINYFNGRGERFESAKKMTFPVDPS